jgi:hypothetical protein
MVLQTLALLASTSSVSAPDTVMDGLNATRRALETASDFWHFWLQVGTAAVVAGVVIEFIGLIIELIGDDTEIPKYEPAPHLWTIPTKVPWWKRAKKETVAEFVGCLIVTAGVALELYADSNKDGVETRLRGNEAAIQKELTTRANSATAAAVALAGNVGGLAVLVSETNGKIDLLTATATDQKARSDAIIASLTAKRKEVETIIAAAKKDETVLAAAADTIKNLQQQIHDLTADRTIDVDRVAAKTKAFNKTPFVITVADERDAFNLTALISQALERAHWEWRDDRRSDNGVETVKNLPGKPQMRLYPSRGISVMYAPADKAAFQSAAKALAFALGDEQLKYISYGELTSEQIEVMHLPTGVIHIFIGVKY